MEVNIPLAKSLGVASLFTAVVVVGIPFLLLHGFSAPVAFEFGAGGIIAMMLFIAGATVSLTCVKDFIFNGRGTPAPFDPPKTLVVRGFYRYVRNPMYLGLFLVIGCGLALGRATANALFLKNIQCSITTLL